MTPEENNRIVCDGINQELEQARDSSLSARTASYLPTGWNAERQSNGIAIECERDGAGVFVYEEGKNPTIAGDLLYRLFNEALVRRLLPTE